MKKQSEKPQKKTKDKLYTKRHNAVFGIEKGLWEEAQQLFPNKMSKFIGQFVSKLVDSKKRGIDFVMFSIVETPRKVKKEKL